MLREQDLDILAVQEVRFESGDHTHNQIGELAAFLPGYQVCQSRHLSCHILWSSNIPLTPITVVSNDPFGPK